MNTTIYQTKPCLLCHHSSFLEVDTNSLLAWQSGQYIQDAFPDWDAPHRELLISGTHPDCWNIMFIDDDDSDDLDEE